MTTNSISSATLKFLRTGNQQPVFIRIIETVVQNSYHWLGLSRLWLVGLVVSLLLIAATFPQVLCTADPLAADAQQAFLPSLSDHWLGTDENGRDVYARAIFGTRSALFVGLGGTALGLGLGTLMGLVAGLSHRFINEFIMRCVDGILSIPDLLDAKVDARLLRLNGCDIQKLGEGRLRQVRGKEIGYVMEDTLGSLDPLKSVGSEISESLRLHGQLSSHQIKNRVLELLGSVGISEAATRARQYPFQLSSGLRQRALIASAIVCNPRVLVADEPTTSLDAVIQSQILDLCIVVQSSYLLVNVSESLLRGHWLHNRKSLCDEPVSSLDISVQAQILELLDDLKNRLSLSTLFISHDLGIIRRVSKEVLVMKSGSIVESGPIDDIFENPPHPYSKELINAIPRFHKSSLINV